MSSLIVYNYDKQGYFTNESVLDESDRNPKNSKDFLLPANCTLQKMPKAKKGYIFRWDGQSWQYEKALKPEVKEGYKVVWQNRRWVYSQCRKSVVAKYQETKLIQLKKEYLKQRDEICWLELGDFQYGFDCRPDDVSKFLATYLAAQTSKINIVKYKVWLTNKEKDLVEFTFAELLEVFHFVRQKQLEAYLWYKNLKSKICKAKTKKALEAIVITA